MFWSKIHITNNRIFLRLGKKMKFSKYLITIALFNTLLVGFNNQVFSWGIFNLFSDEEWNSIKS